MEKSPVISFVPIFGRRSRYQSAPPIEQGRRHEMALSYCAGYSPGVRAVTDFLSREEFFASRNRSIGEAYIAGEPISAIAARHNITEGTVRTIAQGMGAKRPKAADRRALHHNSKVERNKRICEAYLSGLTLESVALENGITRERVRQILVSSNIEERHGGFVTPSRIEARQRQVARRQVAADRKERIATERGIARAYYDQGKQYQEIAALMGRSVGYVQAAIWKTGGPSRNGGAGKPKRYLAESDKHEIARRYAAGENIQIIARDFGICDSTVAQTNVTLGAPYGRRLTPKERRALVDGSEAAQ